MCAATMMINTVAITVTTPTCPTNTTGISLTVPVAIVVVPTIAIVIAAAVGAATVIITAACTTIMVVAETSIVAAITIIAIPCINIVAAAIIAVTTAATARGPCTIPTVVMTTGILPITATVGHGGIMGDTRCCDRWRTHHSRTWPRQQRNTIATAREQASRAREDGFCGDGTVTIGLRGGRERCVRRHANCTLHLVGVDVQPLAPGASGPLAAGVVVRLVHREVPGLQHLHGAHRHHQRDDHADEYAIREARHAVGVVEGALVARQQGRAGLRADTLEQLVGATGTLDGFLVAAAVARE